MIGRLTGLLLEKNPPQVTVDVGGVGTFHELDQGTLRASSNIVFYP